jgi:hypothetical protein
MDADELKEVIVQLRTLDDAARVGMIKALDRAGKGRTEYGGIIFKDPDTGMFYLGTHDGKAMEPVQGERDAIDLSGRKTKSSDLLAGSYHTHPPKDTQGRLSGADVGVAQSSGVPVFMGQAYNREGRVFDPSRDRARSQRGANGEFMESTGRAFMPGHLMVREDPSVLDADKAARAETERSQSLVAEILRKPR